MLERREAWFDGQLDLDPERLIFIDETGTTTKMARARTVALRAGSACAWRCRKGIGRPRR